MVTVTLNPKGMGIDANKVDPDKLDELIVKELIVKIDIAQSFAITPNGDLVILLPQNNVGFRSFAAGTWAEAEAEVSEGDRRRAEPVPK